VPPSRAKDSLLTDTLMGLGRLLLDIGPERLGSALEEILATRTLRAEIAEVLHAYRKKSTLPESPVFQSEAGAGLKRELERRNGKLRVKEMTGRATICPHCYCTCCSSVASSLQTNRMAAICTSCGWVILRTIP